MNNQQFEAMQEAMSSPEHAGWLMACVAPSNIYKGKKMMEAFDDASKARAIAYRNQCLKAYYGASEEDHNPLDN